MTRPALAAAGATGAVTAVLAAGWIGVALLLTAILVPAATLCWILADSERPQRFALLLAAWRHDTPATRRRPPPQRIAAPPAKPRHPKHPG